MPVIGRQTILAFGLLACLVANFCNAGETLYNGIELPDQWPPMPGSFSKQWPVEPPYLLRTPEVIPIDIGRQLFVDDFLIQTTTLKREFHLPQWHEGNPILKPEKLWEIRKGSSFAAPFSDGVWFDPRDGLLKMWYMGGNNVFFCYATSKDGIHWDRPELKEFDPGTNVLKIEPIQRDSSTVWLDLDDPNPDRRFKLVYYRAGLKTRFSADGIHWSDIVNEHKEVGDRTTVFYNPFRKVWVYSVRIGRKNEGRSRYYIERKDLTEKPWTKLAELSQWICSDDLDRVRVMSFAPSLPDLYNLDCTPYESLMVGLFTIHSAPATGSRPKLNHVALGYSRDGYHWSRPDRRAFLNLSEDTKAWNYGNVQSVGGGFLVMGDRLYFYCSGRNSGKDPDDGSGGRTGLAFLRRDGFASLNAVQQNAQVVTRFVRFKGQHLFVNVDNPQGELRVEILDEKGKPFPAFTRELCQPIHADSTLQKVTWEGSESLEELVGKSVRFRFILRGGKLYSFWVSPDATGASHGYVAAGGLGLTGHTDTVGEKGYEPFKTAKEAAGDTEK